MSKDQPQPKPDPQSVQEYLNVQRRAIVPNTPAHFDAEVFLTGQEREKVKALKSSVQSWTGPESTDEEIRLHRMGQDVIKLRAYRQAVEKGFYNEGLGEPGSKG